MSKLEQMKIFYYVATWQSFSRAAIALEVSKGYVSTQISALEQDLKVTLLHRTTRHLSLTEAGELFFESCSKIVKEEQAATAILKDTQLEPTGHLKITAPLSMCNTFLKKLLPEFQKKHPKISLTIDSSATVKNLLQHGIDIALRITHTPDENYIARVLSNFRFVVCATPSYLKRHTAPKKPEALSQHNCLIYSADPSQNRWPFQIAGTTEIVKVQGNLFSDSSALVVSALLANQGIARLPSYIVEQEIKNKKIEVLFANEMQITMPIYAIYASDITISPKVKAFINFIKEKI